MAGLTVGGKSRLVMVRIGCPIVIRMMAIDTACGCPAVSSIGMTQTAVGCPVLSSKRPDQAVLERRPLPTVRRHSVTNRTGVGKLSPLVIWVRGSQIVLLVTSRTFRRGACVLTVAMALEAIRYLVLTHQGKRRMIEDGALPRYGTRVTELTVGGKICSQVIRVFHGLELARMTSGAFGCGSSKAPTAVALPTFEGTMLAFQTKACHRLVDPRAGNQPLP
jgi:hypothetical protein